jgi:hypothetical protein
MNPIGMVFNIALETKLIPVSFVLVTLIIFVCLARWTSLLRDEISDSKEFIDNQQQQQVKQGKPVSNERPFSLSKVQLGIWTMVISSSYIYLSLFKGDCGETDINKTALILFGIFSGTAVSSKIIDKREIKDQRPRHQNTPSGGFFTDILSDDLGISIHRFQHVVWTLVGVMVYLYKIGEIKTGCVLPDLSDTLLTLMGISSATFLAIRSKENDPEAVQNRVMPVNRPAPAPPVSPYQPPVVSHQHTMQTGSGGNDFYG